MSLMKEVCSIMINKGTHVPKTSKIFFIDAPEHRMEKLTSKFPAGNFPSINGWLVHVNTF